MTRQRLQIDVDLRRVQRFLDQNHADARTQAAMRNVTAMARAEAQVIVNRPRLSEPYNGFAGLKEGKGEDE